MEFDSQPQQNVCRVGAIVTHPGKPEWGRGKVLDVNGDTLTIYFCDCPGENPRDAVKKIKLRYVTLELAELQTDWRLDGLTLESIGENPYPGQSGTRGALWPLSVEVVSTFLLRSDWRQQLKFLKSSSG
ncbi:MAG TPA: DUF3553 domain-containing protein [Terriglobales bacterium]|nr:DUF3553 domain-containing protein [Terriglobales bacterium]